MGLSDIRANVIGTRHIPAKPPFAIAPLLKLLASLLSPPVTMPEPELAGSARMRLSFRCRERSIQACRTDQRSYVRPLIMRRAASFSLRIAQKMRASSLRQVVELPSRGLGGFAGKHILDGPGEVRLLAEGISSCRWPHRIFVKDGNGRIGLRVHRSRRNCRNSLCRRLICGSHLPAS